MTARRRRRGAAGAWTATGLAAGIVAAGLAGCSRGPATGDLAGWNVLLVTIDTMRADHVGFAGDKAASTPVMDGLAEEGVSFETAVAAAPVTLPSHATILTGRYPPAHGALDNGVYSLPDDVPTLATRLKAEGWQTGAVVGAYVLHRQYGLARGFDAYDDRFRRPRARGGGGMHSERRAGAVVDRALEWLGTRDPARPFLLWAHFYDPHAPYDPPPEYRVRFASSPYDGEIAYTDASLGRLLEALGRAGVLERTLVIVTSDHGEAFGDGGEQTHGVLLRESTLRVPWLMWAHDMLPPGRRVRGVVSGADLVPTVLDLLGLPPMEGADGTSLVAAMGSGRSEGRVAYSETVLPRDQYGWSDLAGARDDRWARVMAPIPELYDLAADPTEQDNLGDEPTEPARRLDDVIASVRAGARDAGHRTMGDEEMESLRSLGYVVSPSAPEFTGADPKERVGLWKKVDEAQRALDAGKPRDVLSITEEILAVDPGNRVARGLKGEALVGLGRFDEGLDELREVFEETGSLDHDGSILARALAVAGRTDEAERLLRTFIAAQPLYAEHRFNLGVLLAQSGRLEEAAAEYEAARERNPDAVHILSNLAVTLAKLGRDPDRAVELIDRAVELAGGDDRPRLMRAQVLHDLGREEEARSALRELQRKPRLQGVDASEVADTIRSWEGR